MDDEFKIGMAAIVLIVISGCSLVAYLGSSSSNYYQQRYELCVNKGGSWINSGGDGICLQGLKVTQ